MQGLLKSASIFGVWLSLSLSLAAGPAPSSERPPNILLALADDLGWPYAGAYGCAMAETPAFDQIAADGVLFTHAFVASPSSGPSRAALLTGRPIWQLGEAGTQASSFPLSLTVFPDLLERSGYYIGYTGKGWGPGNWMVSGWTRNPAGREFNRRRLMPSRDGLSDLDYAANFQEFLEARPSELPFYFWYGSHEPHRNFAEGAGRKAGKLLEAAQVPAFLPDVPEVRGDFLDYAMEIEHFDRHLQKMLRLLEAKGELDRTLVIVTSDSGLPFPRAKPNLYDAGTRVPLAVAWPGRIQPGRVVTDFVSLTDVAPTLLEAARLPAHREMTGRSFLPVLLSEKSGRVDATRNKVFLARERHASARINNLGYPSRGIRTDDYLFIRNFSPNRWPSGAASGAVEADEAAGYYEIDDSPSKEFMVEWRHSDEFGRFFQLATAKRPAEELYQIRGDPGNLTNLIKRLDLAKPRYGLRTELLEHLRSTGDPRMHGRGDLFDSYPRYGVVRDF